MRETIDQSILEDQAHKVSEDRRISRLVSQQGRMGRTRLLVGLSFGLVLLLSGIVLIKIGRFDDAGQVDIWHGNVWLNAIASMDGFLGLVLLPIGVWSLVSVIMGGLGEDAMNRVTGGYVGLRGGSRGTFIQLDFVRYLFGSRKWDRRDSREKSGKAETVDD